MRDSNMDWTTVRLAFPTNDPHTGQVRVGYLNGDTGIRISRADAAEFMLREMQESRRPCQAPVISN
jgi:hypothetical protein